MNLDWHCTIDECGKEAHYHAHPNYYCHEHWWVHLHPEKEIDDTTRDNAEQTVTS